MAKDSSLAALGQTIKNLRKTQKMSLQDVAAKSDVSAGLLSRIENFRTVPSLPVLLQIAKALNSTVSELVYGIKSTEETPFLIVRKGEWTTEERDDSQGMTYQSVLSESCNFKSFKANMVSLEPGVDRQALANDAQEIILVLDGTVKYGFPQASVTLNEGDTLYFNGRSPHSVQNLSDKLSSLFVLYFMD